MKLILSNKLRLLNLHFSFSSHICLLFLLFYCTVKGQIVETYTSATASSLNAVSWAANTPYIVNQYVHSVDMTSGTAVNRLYKVTVAGTSNTTQPTGTADIAAGATFSYIGIIPLSSTWTCPTGVTSIQVECWGGGGAGGSASTASSSGNRSGGGGGAGSYVKKTIAVVPGTVYNLIVGVGGFKGGTSSASAYYGNVGGKSEFSGPSITALTASGGTGGTGAGASNLNTNPGGVLGGVYAFSVAGTKTTNYTTSSVITLSGGVGSGATAALNTSSGAVTYLASTNQGIGYTSNPAVSVSIGAGQTFLAYTNPNINSTGAGIITTLGSDGGASSTTSGGTGGTSPDGLPGGVGGTGTSVGGYIGATATNPGAGGGGGFSFYASGGSNASGAGGAGANGKIVITYTAPIITYTYDGTGDLHDVSNWVDESNNHPSLFTADFQIFKINSNASTTAPWTVSGAASKIVVGDATNTNVSLTITSGSGITAPMDVTNGNKVYVQDVIPVSTSFYMNHPAFGSLGDTSEVHYQNNTVNNALVKTAFNYGKLYIDGNGTGTVFFSGATNPTNHNVKTLFEVAEGSAAYFSDVSYYYMTLNAGAQANIYGTLKTGKAAGFVSSNVGTAASTFGSLQFIGSEALTLGANSTIEYNRASLATTQTITPRTDYVNVTLIGLDNNKSFTSATNISGTLKLNVSGTSTLSGAANLTLGNGATITRTSGSLNASPNFGTTTNIVYDGTTAITTSFEIPVSGLNNLTINNAANVTLASSNTVNGILNFVSGKLITGNNFVTIGTSGSVGGAGSGWVVGNLSKQTATNASPTFLYTIGDATEYTPISLTFNGNNTASVTGSITASTASGDHAAIAASGLDSTKNVNRIWTLINNGVTGFTNCDASFTYAIADNDGIATPANYVVRRYENSVWSSTTASGTSTITTASVSGITSFGDFIIGETSGLPSFATQPINGTICSGSDVTFTAASNTNLPSNIKWQRSIDGISWSDINANLDSGTVYSGFTTGTLTLTGSNNTINNYQYKAVCTTINGSTDSNVVALNVVTTNAPSASDQTFCVSGTVANLTATGSSLNWFSVATNGTPLASTDALISGTYYVSQTENSCESSRTSFIVTVNSQPAQPSTACYETATFNTANCSWIVTGSQPVQPTTACYETATFNTATCSWDVTGSQPVQPTTACYETATFNTANCSWVVTGSQPVQPTTACYETAAFNTANCSWVVTGSQPVQPTLACYESATFNTTNCSWVVTGSQPVQPTLACYESATFNASTCIWDVSGTPISAPTGATSQSLNSGQTIADLVVIGNNIVWYSSSAEALSNTNPLALTTVLINGNTYYAMQTINGCSSSTPLAVVVTINLANANFDLVDLEYYPNPVTDNLNVLTDQKIDAVTIYNLVGQQLKLIKPNTTTLQIDMSNLPQGIYLLQIDVKDKHKIIKVMKK